ncbi:RagB/SusD family nutrient uptake outer membrane protein [Fodinibius salsisoli]|uniref:RagB/SusD family nutrient uptake outer membrane protein n=1 Tax=Fodinibius salsisoli TaxID=2820877 RepID=A0ABT3PJE6_9BACT|nr:RagB/SusD family nutrient uptake outer membrane protein [Fodinibius salsisoli]MCW9706065.1 RagB/SusD family nutrient uptake outer membrane protein [Fodinibius salsisoli]
MKRLKNNLLLGFLASLGMVLIVGCSDMLEPKVYTELTPDTFFQSPADFENALVGIYDPFSSDWAGLYNADPKNYLLRGEVSTDLFYTPWYINYSEFTWGPAGFNGDQIYDKIRTVALATDLIDKMGNSDVDISQDLQARYVAEAKTLRAFIMYILLDYWGPVNPKLDPETLSDDEIIPRMSEEAYVQQMLTDLDEAIPNLDDKYNGDAENWGRMSKGVARMVKLRIHMHQKNWAEAESVGKELMNMGYSLMDDYEAVFNVEQNQEIIYAVPANGQSPNYYLTEILPPGFRSSVDGSITDGDGGWYGYWIPWEFYDKFSDNDARKETILDEYKDSGGNTIDARAEHQGAIPVKFTEFEGNGPDFSMDQPVFRYAEVLLSVAEAINEQDGPTAEALSLANQVRERSFDPADMPSWSGLGQEAFRDSLLLERGREFYAEGLRRTDLIRHGEYINRAQDRGLNAEDHHVLYPIPQEVITEGDGTIEQNPGYTQ